MYVFGSKHVLFNVVWFPLFQKTGYIHVCWYFNVEKVFFCPALLKEFFFFDMIRVSSTHVL